MQRIWRTTFHDEPRDALFHQPCRRCPWYPNTGQAVGHDACDDRPCRTRRKVEAYDRMIAADNKADNAVVKAAIDRLVDQTATIERIIASRDNPGTVVQEEGRFSDMTRPSRHGGMPTRWPEARPS